MRNEYDEYEPYKETYSDAFRLVAWSVFITLIVFGGFSVLFAIA